MTAPVTVYSQPGCQPCRLVKKRLYDAGIEFEDVDITKNEDARTYVTEVLGASTVPVIVTDTHDPIVGFRLEQLTELIHDYVYEEDE